MNKEVKYEPIPHGSYINQCMATIPASGKRCYRAADVLQKTTEEKEGKKEVVSVLQLCHHHAREEQRREAIALNIEKEVADKAAAATPIAPSPTPPPTPQAEPIAPVVKMSEKK